MRTATFPPVRVEPETRAQVEAVLREGESLTQFIEDAVKREAAWRFEQRAFVARGQAALEEYKRTGGHPVDDMLEQLRRKGTAARERLSKEAPGRKGKAT
jgi:hypothetical protein